jgi:Cu-Zn family superoxide dismutase
MNVVMYDLRTFEPVGSVQAAPHRDGGTAFYVSIITSRLGAGPHGFHVHEKPDVRPTQKPSGEVVYGGAAGSHFDPKGTGKHLGPYRNGHLGDLPFLTFDGDGNCIQTVYAPRFPYQLLPGKSLIIHLGGDNYTDHPPNGGGKARVLGGVIR